MTIDEILQEHGHSARLGVIDLGWENGWSGNTVDLFQELKPFWVKDTYSRSGSASWQRMSVKLKHEDEEYQLRWQLDSGD